MPENPAVQPPPTASSPTTTWPVRLAALGVVLLTLLTRLTALNQYLIVDEPDRWRWAEDFVLALTRGDLAATRVGDGYPGIVPVWAESLWILLEAARRSLVEGQWIGDTGLNFLLHEWERTAYLYQQRLPIVLLNIALALLIIRAVWRLFGPRVGLVAGVLIALDPFYLSDSRVNRAEAVITGLMTLSVLALVFYQRTRQWRYVFLSGVLGGLSFLTKIQALALLPTIAVVGVYLELAHRPPPAGWRETAARLAAPGFWWPVIRFGLVWSGAALATWVVLWPSMWVIPLDTLALVYNYTTRKVGAEGVNLFFMGRTYQDADPGLLFYPVVLFMRLSPVTLLGLAGWAVRRFRQKALADHPGLFILTAYALLYALVMTIGSHKQDRYLLPIFLSLDILAAVQLVNYQLSIFNSQFKIQHSTFKIQNLFLPVLAAVQLAVVLPHHPYYYSYFNPLFGGGRTAVKILRIGWGEGMDLVGDYLAAKSNSRELVVATRFTHNMVRFRGEAISLQADGRWTQADYIVLYIHQVQRRIDPDPQFIDYFLTRRTPEKVIRLGGIDYAWIYPIPFTTAADPQVSRIEGQASLLGYRWQTDPPGLRLFWRSLDRPGDRQIAVRLAGDEAATAWTTCRLDPAFAPDTATAGAYLESVCTPRLDGLPPGLYSVEVGLANGGEVAAFTFPQGLYAARRTPSGQMEDTPESERLDALVDRAAGEPVNRLDRLYGGRLRLAAYRLDPPEPRPGDRLAVTLYWQRVGEVLTPLRLTVQMADSRLLPLGREDRSLNADRWLAGLVVSTTHRFDLPQTLDAPLAAQVEVELADPAEVALPPATSGGEPLDKAALRLTVAPPAWPDPPESGPVAVWQAEDGQPLIGLYGVQPETETGAGTLTVRLYWAALAQVNENYQVFVHLLDESGQIVSQHDGLPRGGGYPTPWWPADRVVEDAHSLPLPPDLPPGTYRLAVGLYRPEDGRRLRLVGGKDYFVVGLPPASLSRTP